MHVIHATPNLQSNSSSVSPGVLGEAVAKLLSYAVSKYWFWEPWAPAQGSYFFEEEEDNRI